MMLKSFKIGGVHPSDNKLSKSAPIEYLPIPKTVIIPLSQHIGAPATALVAKGDSVKVGDMIGKSGGFISANIHASVSGTVQRVEPIKDAAGVYKLCVVIDTAEDQWNEQIDRSAELNTQCTLSAAEIVKKITDAGIVGLGGAAFPTQVKLMIPAGKKATALVVNGVECEPYLTADHRLMLEKTDEIIVGIRLLCRAIGVNKAYVGIENNKPDAIAAMQASAQKEKEASIEIVPLKLKYPQGSEKQLVDAIIGRQIPSGALPIEVGAVVQNVGTAFAVYEAVQKNKPLFERVVTVTGKSLSQPKNLMVRVGTPISELIDYCGGVPEAAHKIIAGGPMMGRAMANLGGSVVKGTSGILLMDSTESLRNPESACIRCAKCVGVCPMGLEPYLINELTRLGRFEDLLEHAPFDCVECGSCSFTCPANIPLLDNIRVAKSETMKLLKNPSKKQ